MYKLYGDGIHDDTNAIQEMIDSGACEVRLPVPERLYLISKPLELPSDFRLVLPRFAEIKLADGSDCVMLKNKTVANPAKRVSSPVWEYINEYDPDYECRNIEVCGGIWNCNNLNQTPNPIFVRENLVNGYNGMGFLFYNVKNLTVRSLTVKDPVTFGVTFDKVSYFTVEYIIFDYNYGNPKAFNMDGIHINGNSHFGRITNLKGATYDDLVALNADEGSNGPITHIDIRGLYAEGCHSAVRLLTRQNVVEHIHISDVYGTFYQYCIGLTKYYQGEIKGYFDSITIDNVYASKAERLPVCEVYPGKGYIFPLIFIEGEHKIKNLKISDFHRREYINSVETIFIGKDTVIDNFIMENVTTENNTSEPDMPLIINNGTIKNMNASNVLKDGETV